jgi:hypothetical protein
MVRTEIGECALTHKGVRYEFRPSFKNIRKICSPADIAKLYSDVSSVIESKIDVAENLNLFDAVSSYSKELREKIILVLSSCCDTDCSKMTDNEKHAPTFAIKHVAMSLLNHGVIGVESESKGKSSKNKKSDIDVYEYADIAESHLGIPYPLSENLTKTELDRKLKVKFPGDKKSRKPTLEEHRHNMDLARRIESARSK